MSERHAPWERRGDGDTAVLLIHGIVGTPRHFLFLADSFPREWSLFALRLAGHGGDVRAFGKASMAQWKAQAENELDALRRQYRRVILVGHSMGTLISLDIARRCPEKVAGLILFAVPVCIRLTLKAPWDLMHVLFERVREDDPSMVATREAYGVDIDRRFWRYIPWVPRYLELFALSRRTRKAIGEISVPCYAIQSKNDEMVSRRALKVLEGNPSIVVEELPAASHHYYPPEDKAYVCARVAAIARKIG